MAEQDQRDMTPAEREAFERETVHHEEETRAGGPASEPEIAPDAAPPDERH